MPKLLSVNVGLPRDVTWNGKTVRTSVWKSPVDGRRIVRKLDIDGDAQADLAGHGGEHRAVFVYQMDSYHYWERFLGRNDFTLGQFGENFTVEGLPDNEVCIGDRYRIGGAEFDLVTGLARNAAPAKFSHRLASYPARHKLQTLIHHRTLLP
jgi:MOSC domain-containing protein YiiM